AVAIIRDHGYTAPIVALTAFALVGEAEQFLKNGFDGFLSKPIQTSRLNTILHRFIREKHNPSGKVNDVPAHEIEDYFKDYLDDEPFREKLFRDFARSQQNVIEDIKTAINESNLPHARILAHSLKGLSGLIGEATLMSIAKDTEQILAKEDIPNAALMESLAHETKKILKRINQQYPPLITPIIATPLDKEEAAKIFDTITPLLQSKNVDALDLLPDLAQIPQTELLATQIGDFDFGPAIKTIEKLREEFGI
ncbi:MAG: Hpt domain-containing protein, partial [Defluviitaleaceae bacterium]|nr:Hpt domain-containing protein [Defluviitaleaceae bacterium]